MLASFCNRFGDIQRFLFCVRDRGLPYIRGPGCPRLLNKGRVGRHTTNLLDVLRSGLKETGVRLRLARDLVKLREMATDGTRWRRLSGEGLIVTLRCLPTISIAGTVISQYVHVKKLRTDPIHCNINKQHNRLQ